MRKLIYPLIAAAAMATAVAILAPPDRGPRAAGDRGRPTPRRCRTIPTMGDLMSILIQPRHVKLWLAGHQENWPLAGYALKEIKQSFARIAAGMPQHNGAPVADLIETAMGSRSGSIDFAIKAGEPRQFTEQYGEADRRLQCLPRLHRPSLHRHQGAGRRGVRQPGVPAEAMIAAIRSRDSAQARQAQCEGSSSR